MQEVINSKAVALPVKTVNLTAAVLKGAITSAFKEFDHKQVKG